jgi:hypothetical protein
MLQGERKTARFARVLGIEHLSKKEQQAEVKRVKDKLKKRIEGRVMAEPLERLALRMEEDPFFLACPLIGRRVEGGWGYPARSGGWL